MTRGSFALRLDQIALRMLADARPPLSLEVGSRVLFVRSTSYGDFATFLPFLTEAAKKVGRRNLSLLLLSRHGRVGEAMLGHNSGISMLTFDASTAARFPFEILRVGFDARRLNASHALFCGPALDSPLPRVKRMLLTRTLVGFRRPMSGFGCSPPLLQSSEARVTNGVGVVNQAMMPFAQLGLAPSIDRGEVFAIVGLDATEREHAAELIPRCSKIVGICAGSRLARKRWPGERFTELAKRLLCDPSVGIIFVGGDEDRAVIRDVLRGLRDVSRVRIAAGVLSLRETVALAPHLSVCVGNDGAAGHLCALGGTPVVSIFCDWEPPGIWEPVLAPASRSLRPSEASRERGDYGISSLSVDAVESATLELLHGASGHELIEIGTGDSPQRRRLAGFPL